MDGIKFHGSNQQRSWGMKALQGAVMALLLAVALPGRAEDRAVKSRVPPVYPEIAKRMRISGVVKIQATVDADGKVTDAKAVSGNHVLGAAAEEAVRKWKFESGAGTATVELEINFAMAN